MLRRISKNFEDSLRELLSVRSLVTVSLLLSIQVILGLFSLPINNAIQISFEYLPLCICAMLYGPVPAMLSGALCDVIVAVIRPTGPFFIGFTFSAALSGLIYGLLLYRKNSPLLWRFAVSRLLAVVICNIVLNTLWVYVLYGAGSFVYFPGRAIKNVIEYPVSLFLLCTLERILPRIMRRKPSSFNNR